jgi:spermidine synthase
VWAIPDGSLEFEVMSKETGVLQEWIAPNPDITFCLEANNETGGVSVTFVDLDKRAIGYIDSMFRKRIQKLNRLKNIEYSLGREKYAIPRHEWEAIWEFHLAYVDALKRAVYALAQLDPELYRDDEEDVDETEVCSLLPLWSDHYDDFSLELDTLAYNNPECDSSEIIDFRDYVPYETERSNYQEMVWQYREEDDDICLHLDNMLQICKSYRPHYHEFFVHFPARYVDSVKRVVYLGSGDAMLLHEILKYPNLEKVVGLELDQDVTRKSFKHFKTQPHYDDDRVEWWYGDATKSLPLLPRDYWGSFDLLLVDLSETVVSLHVTGNRDVLDVISMLLKPEGVMLENELYIDKMSKHFDHTVHIFYGSPKVCTQVHTVSSNGVDFLRSPIKDHGVEMFLIDPIKEESDNFKYIHDYVKTDALKGGKCKDAAEGGNLTTTEHGRKAGVVMILEAENTTVPLDTLEESIYLVLQKEGLTPMTTPSHEEGTITVVMKEGYVVARTWPELKYVGFDINLWGAFQKMTNLRSALAEAVGSTALSSYRVVVGGMHGTNTWDDDQNEIGVQFSQKRKCAKEAPLGDAEVGEETLQIVLAESVLLLEGKDLVVAVLCGRKGAGDCSSADELSKHPNVKIVIPIWPCDDIPDFADGTSDLSGMYDCEKSMIATLEKAHATQDMVLDMFVMDPSAPLSILQIFSSIWSDPEHREEWLRDEYVFVAPYVGKQPKRRRFLDIYRQHKHDSAVYMGEFTFRGASDSYMGLRVLTHGDDFAVHSLYELERDLMEKLEGITISLRLIEGGDKHIPSDMEIEGRSFLPDAYDSRPNEKQFSEQQPLGRQTIFQLDLVKDAAMPAFDKISQSLKQTLAEMEYSSTKFDSIPNTGDGGVLVSTFVQGSVLLIWDGLHHIDINLFCMDQDKALADTFLEKFARLSGGRLQLSLRDDQPRGIGRVVNFSSDIEKDNMQAIREK